MSLAAIVFLVGLTILLAALFLVVVAWWREDALLSRLPISATRSDAAEALRGELGDAAVVLEHALTSKRAVDEGLATALATVSQAPLGAPLLQGLAVDALLVVGALSPLLASLLAAADDIAALPAAVAGSSPYVTAVAAIPAAFDGIQQGAKLSAMLVVIAGVVAVVRYALLRPEIRESRALHALVHATANGAPDVRLPQSAKLLALLAPSTTLRPALLGAVAFMAMSAAATAALVVTAPLRAANDVPLTYGRWPDLFVESGELAPPAVAAGRALAKGPSLIIGRDQVQLGAAPMTPLEQGLLPVGWATQALVPRELSADARPLLVAAPSTPLPTVVGVLAFLAEKHGITQVQAVVRRHPPSVRGEPTRVQAGLPLVHGTAGAEAVVLDVEPGRVRLGDDVLVLERLDGLRRLQAALGPGARRLGLRAHGAITYGRLIEVAASADGLCEGGVDCGLPGRGLTIVIEHVPAAE